MQPKRLSNAKKKNIASLTTLAVVAVVFLILRALMAGGALNSYYSGLITMASINVVAAVSLNLVTGMLGQLVLGHAGFMLVGAYAAAIFTTSVNGLNLYVALPVGLLLGGLLAAVMGLLIGLPALRLRGDYLAIITLGFGEIIRVVANNISSVTGGAKGYSSQPKFPRGSTGMFEVAFICACLTIFVIYTLGTSRQGRAILSIREDEIAAEASGVNTTYYKLLAFATSAFFAGVAGGLYAHYIGIIQPAKFDFNYSVEILMMVVLGGMGSITGSVLAAGVLTALPELLRDFASYRMLIYSVILITVMLFRTKGLLGRKEIAIIKPFEWLLAKLRKKPAGEGGAKP